MLRQNRKSISGRDKLHTMGDIDRLGKHVDSTDEKTHYMWLLSQKGQMGKGEKQLVWLHSVVRLQL